MKIVIMAHGKQQEVFDQHEPLWHIQQEPLIVCCPEDDPVQTLHEIWKFDKAAHSGIEAAKRIRKIFFELERTQWEHCLILEYDSFLLSRLSPSNGFFGIPFANHETGRFMAPRYANPPWFFDRESFERMQEKAKKYPALYEEGFSDRFYSALAYLSGVPVLNFDPPGFSRAPITERDLPQIREVVLKGGFAFHGIKNRQILEAILRFRRESQSLLNSG